MNMERLLCFTNIYREQLWTPYDPHVSLECDKGYVYNYFIDTEGGETVDAVTNDRLIRSIPSRLGILLMIGAHLFIYFQLIKTLITNCYIKGKLFEINHKKAYYIPEKKVKS